MNEQKKLSVCIVTYNNSDKIGTAVSSLKEQTKGINYTLYISDNASSDDTINKVLECDENAVILQNGGNIGFGKAHNKVIPLISSEYHAVVNPDIIVDYDVLSALCKYLDENSDVSMVTPKVLFPNGEEQVLPKRKPRLKYLLGRRIPLFAKYSDEYTRINDIFNEPEEIEFCSGCFFVIRTAVFKKLGGFDDRFFMYMEDADLTLRAKKFGKTMFNPLEHVIHTWERSSSKSLKYLMIHISSMLKFMLKH